MYRLVCKHFSDREHAKADAASNKAADEWIDCWAGCANVLVQNNYKVEGLLLMFTTRFMVSARTGGYT